MMLPSPSTVNSNAPPRSHSMNWQSSAEPVGILSWSRSFPVPGTLVRSILTTRVAVAPPCFTSIASCVVLL